MPLLRATWANSSVRTEPLPSSKNKRLSRADSTSSRQVRKEGTMHGLGLLRVTPLAMPSC